MKKWMVILVMGMILCGWSVLWADEKEVLQLKAQVLQQEIAKMDAQFQYMQIRYPAAQKELQEIINKLQQIQQEELKSKEVPKK